MDKGSRRKARMSAVQALYQWDVSRQHAAEIETHFISDREMSDAEKSYFETLVRQVPKEVEDLDKLFKPFVVRTVEVLDPVEKAILRVATWELCHRPEIPYRVVINEAIELAKTFGADESYRFINGIMDKVARETRKAECG